MNKGEATRDTILHQAFAESTRSGLEALSIGGLAKEVGMSKSGLYAHFESKEDLQLGVVDLAAQRFIKKVIEPALRQPRGEPRVRAIFENWLHWSRSQPGGCLFIAAAAEFDDQPGSLRDRLVKHQRDWLRALARAASICVEEGHFRADLDTEQFAHDLHGIFLIFQYYSRLLRDAQAESRARTSFEQLIQRSRA